MSDRIDVGGIFRCLEADRDMALRAEIVDLVRLDLADDAGEVGGVGQIAIVQAAFGVRRVRILIDVVDPLGVEGRGAALDAVDLVALFEEEFRK